MHLVYFLGTSLSRAGKRFTALPFFAQEWGVGRGFDMSIINISPEVPILLLFFPEVKMLYAQFFFWLPNSLFPGKIYRLSPS